jgi:hypothetical protein
VELRDYDINGIILLPALKRKLISSGPRGIRKSNLEFTKCKAAKISLWASAVNEAETKFWVVIPAPPIFLPCVVGINLPCIIYRISGYFSRWGLFLCFHFFDLEDKLMPRLIPISNDVDWISDTRERVKELAL